MTEEELVEAMCKAAYGDAMAAFFPMRQALRAVRPIIERETLERAAKVAADHAHENPHVSPHNTDYWNGASDGIDSCAAAIRALAEGE